MQSFTVLEGIQRQNMRPNRLSYIYIYIYKSSMNTVLFVNATIGESLFLVNMMFVQFCLDICKLDTDS